VEFLPKPSQLIKGLRDIIGRFRETLPKVGRLPKSNGGDGSGFDNYTSLGRDCEVGFQLKRVRGAPESGFFNWNITDAPALLALLEHDFAGILEAENLSLHGGGSLVHDASHDFMVHHEFDTKLFKDAPDFTRKLKVLRQKFAHFEKKFRETAAAPGKTAYFYKCTHPEARELALAVQALLARYHGANPFSIIIIQTQDRFEPDWGLPGIHNRYVERFAPYNDTPDGHVPSWDAIFREFPHKQPLKLANY
jgi:hypothetical protein